MGRADQVSDMSSSRLTQGCCVSGSSGSSCRECPSGAVADRIQLGNRGFNLDAGLLGDDVRIFQHVGNRSNRNASALSDVLDARPDWSRSIQQIGEAGLGAVACGKAIPGLLLS
jgi:hypothetical protein